MKKAACILLVILMLSSCESAYVEESESVYAMDTVMELKAYGKNAKEALKLSKEKITELDKKLKRDDENSEIYKINTLREAEVSGETAEIIKKALEICEDTKGKFDISLADLSDLWGFYSKDYYLPSDGEISEILSKTGYKNISSVGNKVTLKNNAMLDAGGIAKGYLSGEIAEIFKECKVLSGIVSLGGNVQAIGKKPDGSDWNVAIKHPDNEGYLGVVSVSDTAVITSGAYQRFFERDGKIYHHILDPDTGRPANSGLKSVTVVSRDPALADGLSTAVFVMGAEEGIKFWRERSGFELILMDDSGKISITEGLSGLFESDYEFEVIKR